MATSGADYIPGHEGLSPQALTEAWRALDDFPAWQWLEAVSSSERSRLDPEAVASRWKRQLTQPMAANAFALARVALAFPPEARALITDDELSYAWCGQVGYAAFILPNSPHVIPGIPGATPEVDQSLIRFLLEYALEHRGTDIGRRKPLEEDALAALRAKLDEYPAMPLEEFDPEYIADGVLAFAHPCPQVAAWFLTHLPKPLLVGLKDEDYLELLQSPDPQLRQAAARALGRMRAGGSDGPDATVARIDDGGAEIGPADSREQTGEEKGESEGE